MVMVVHFHYLSTTIYPLYGITLLLLYCCYLPRLSTNSSLTTFATSVLYFALSQTSPTLCELLQLPPNLQFVPFQRQTLSAQSHLGMLPSSRSYFTHLHILVTAASSCTTRQVTSGAVLTTMLFIARRPLVIHCQHSVSTLLPLFTLLHRPLG